MSDVTTVLLLVLGPTGIVAAAITGYFGWKQTRKTSDNTKEIEVVKTTALSKAETVKVEAEAETKRLDAVIDLIVTQVENLQQENKDQRREMSDIRAGTDATRARLDMCLEEKAKESAALHSQITDMEIARREDKAMIRDLQKKVEQLTGHVQNGLLPETKKDSKIKDNDTT